MEKGKISSLQMAFMLYPTIIATAILMLPSFTAQYAKQDLWLSPIWACLIGFLTVFIAIQLNKLYPNQTVIQFSQEIVGRFFGKIVGLLFLIFYIPTTGLITRSYGEFVVDSFLPHTPVVVITGSMILVCSFAIRGGIELLGRVADLFVPIFIITLILLLLLLLPDFNFNNLLPIMEDGFMPSFKGSIILQGWFTEFFLIIFLLPFLKDSKKGPKSISWTVFAVMITLVIVNMSAYAVLGTTTPYKVYPLMNVARYISIANFFEHLEAIFMAVWILGTFVKISIFYYASVLVVAQLLNLSDYRPIVLPVGILIVEFCFWSLPSTVEISHYETAAFPFYALFVQTIIPLFLLLLSLFKRSFQKLTEN
ncbi:endospore germination permease [Bacillus sp. AFS017336]|uniref:GerAB/ArcD/ProY family transporter n=1 Tax=Bacillus sp. AFS017336 TaxID=2033489 RepID=UPI000BF0A69C|nr:endospore germination permease [Bacillus sp. AFS017336]PEK99845.1 spore gernimation protein [Bacillus sp. AFS017336]